VEIKNTTGSVVGQTVTTRRFTFALLKSYQISPDSKSCETEIRVVQGNGLAGDDLGGYKIAAQINMTKGTFLRDLAEKVGSPLTETKHVTVDGADSIMAYYILDGLKHSVTFVPLGYAASTSQCRIIGGYIVYATERAPRSVSASQPKN